MLITLQSDNDANANAFTNFFKEPVAIAPNSEIALVNMAYKFKNAFTIDASTDEFTLELGDSDAFTVALTQGNYTADGFLTELNDGLALALADEPYRTSRAFPQSFQKFAFVDSGKNQLKLTLDYAPVDWEVNPAKPEAETTIVREETHLEQCSLTSDGAGIILNDNNTDAFNISYFNAGQSETDFYYLWGAAQGNGAGQTPHGSFRFTPGQANADIMICLGDSQVPANFAVGAGANGAVSGIRLKPTGNFVVLERDATSGTYVAISGDIAYTGTDSFEIRADIPSDTDNKMRYFKNGTEITNFLAGAERFELRPTLRLVPCGSFKTPTLLQQPYTSADFVANVIDDTASTISTAGTGYLDNEKCVLAGQTSGVDIEIIISATAGAITGFRVLGDKGGFTNGETANVSGITSGSTDGRITLTTFAASSTLSNAGTNYNNNQADLVLGGDTYANAITITAVGGGGEIQTFTWANPLPDGLEDIADGTEFEIHEGGHTDARLTINRTRDTFQSLTKVSFDTVADSDEPLEAHPNSTFSCDVSFSDLTGMPLSNQGTGTHTITGSAGIGTNRETDMMLVNIDEFQLKSICKEGGVQKTVAALPYGQTIPSRDGQGDPEKIDGSFYYEPYNMTYHKLENKEFSNHNQLKVRITDPVGNPLVQLKHPTTITLDLRPRTL